MKNFPNAIVILLGIIVFVWILTYVLPQGAYQRTTDELTGQTKVEADSYQKVQGEHLSAFDLLLAIPNGIVGRADLIVLILIIGGCFYIIEQTGALNEGLAKIVHLLEGKETWALVIVSILFAAAGATIGQEAIAMMPALLIFGKSLGYDKFSVIYMSYGSAVLGSSFSPANPFAVLIAQSEAQLPLLSGSIFRLIIFGIAFIFWLIFLIRYAYKHRIKREERPAVLKTSL